MSLYGLFTGLNKGLVAKQFGHFCITPQKGIFQHISVEYAKAKRFIALAILSHLHSRGIFEIYHPGGICKNTPVPLLVKPQDKDYGALGDSIAQVAEMFNQNADLEEEAFGVLSTAV